MLDERSIITLLSVPKVGRSTVQRVISTIANRPIGLNDLHDILIYLQQIHGKVAAPTMEQLKKADDHAERILERAAKIGIKVLVSSQPAFPKLLRTIPDPPVILYAKGNLSCLNNDGAVAVIGTREPSSYGVRAATRLANIFAQRRLVVVSGLAIGCDTAAHRGCIEARGQTVAVLAHGLDKVYPAENRPLAEEILSADGCLVSEYPPGERAQKSYFVDRDRLQSGLSDAVAVIETDVNGGTMHTVRFCQKQKRILGCLIHSQKYITHPKAQGNKKLLEDGLAFPLGSNDDIEAFITRLKNPSALLMTNASTIQENYYTNAIQESLFDDEE